MRGLWPKLALDIDLAGSEGIALFTPPYSHPPSYSSKSSSPHPCARVRVQGRLSFTPAYPRIHTLRFTPTYSQVGHPEKPFWFTPTTQLSDESIHSESIHRCVGSGPSSRWTSTSPVPRASPYSHHPIHTRHCKHVKPHIHTCVSESGLRGGEPLPPRTLVSTPFRLHRPLRRWVNPRKKTHYSTLRCVYSQ